MIILLNLAGVLSAKRLAKYRRIEIFLVFAFAGFVTPSGDPFTMPALALALCLLYEAAVLFAKWNDRRRARRDEAAEFAGLADTEASPAPIPQSRSSPRSPIEPPRASVSAGGARTTSPDATGT